MQKDCKERQKASGSERDLDRNKMEAGKSELGKANQVKKGWGRSKQ
jgi:hypothetical protein